MPQIKGNRVVHATKQSCLPASEDQSMYSYLVGEAQQCAAQNLTDFYNCFRRYFVYSSPLSKAGFQDYRTGMLPRSRSNRRGTNTLI